MASHRTSLATADDSPGQGGSFRAQGKFIFKGDQKFYLRGVTYGPFRPDTQGCEYHCPEVVERDFRQMQRQGINAVRTYTLPPKWLLDLAQNHGLHLLVGLPWEQHVTFLSEQRHALDIERGLVAAARQCAAHPVVLGYAVGNEIPSPLVRWYGHRRVESFIERLYRAVKSEAPDKLVTYVNYPSTEYLELPFLDFLAFNVYLESPERLESYLARLQNIAGERPLVMGEIGLDSLRHGEERQATALRWQGRTVFEAGCAGLFYFSWTDEWFRGGQEVTDWRFGLTTSDRQPKASLAAATGIFAELPAPARSWPYVSVVVCTYNGGRTLRSCLERLRRLRYPRFEVIVVIDGSTDNSLAIVNGFNVRCFNIPNGGLSNARNLGWREAKAEIVAYLDDDAAPDEHWLTYLVLGMEAGNFAGIGGPNVAWPQAGWFADCVEHSPGNPTHVLLTDREAEHLPGCNMAFRKECLAALGGFDTQFRIAGDDVDLCWRLQQQGWKLGFHPTAMVWHRRRSTLAGYWRQQLNYGKAEAMLERKWPEKYNAVGHATWNGRLYSNSGLLSWSGWSLRRIYHGTWGSAPFQSVYSPAPSLLSSFLMLPEWYLVLALLAVISLCGFIYSPLRYAAVLLAVSLVPPLAHSIFSGTRAALRLTQRVRLSDVRRAAVTAGLHFLQPAARLWGRLCYGLTPWRSRGCGKLAFPRLQTVDLWSEGPWQAADQRLKTFEDNLRGSGAAVQRGGDYDRWDLQVRGGLLGSARLLMVIEEHGQNRQYVRMRLWPMTQPLTLLVVCVFAVLASVAALDLQWTAWALLNVPAILLLSRTFYQCAVAMAELRRAVLEPTHSSPPAQCLPSPTLPHAAAPVVVSCS